MRAFTLSLLTTVCIKAAGAAAVAATSTQPNWFQTTQHSYQGPTATGSAPFLALTNPAPSGQQAYVPNSPLETSQPIKGAKGRNIFHLMGNISPYYTSEEGFGVEEYALPAGSNITQVHLIHRPGSRYPTSTDPVFEWANQITNATTNGTVFAGDLAFLNNWSLSLGAEILVPQGRKELFDSGVLHFYNYGTLYQDGSKIVVRSTTTDRALKSAENFLAGFFGLEWMDHANILPLISVSGYNNSLLGIYNCNNFVKTAGPPTDATATWKSIYLRDNAKKLKKLAGGYNWTVSDSFNAQTLCAYETVALGYSSFCQLFDYREWEGMEYFWDVYFAGLFGFSTPIGRASGIAWVQEFIARVEGHLLDIPVGSTNANMTLDTNPITFPVNQTLYFDFGHDASIMAALTAFGFKQFAQFLPPTGPPYNQQFFTSKTAPFAGRTNIEIIKAPNKVMSQRPTGSQANAYEANTGETYYVHFLLNQRTLPLHASFNECEYRDDGWCELSTFLAIQKDSLSKAKFEYACFGNYTIGEYGRVTDGAPVT